MVTVTNARFPLKYLRHLSSKLLNEPPFTVLVCKHLHLCSRAGNPWGHLEFFLIRKFTLFCSMLRLMEAAESLSTAEWTLLTDVLLLGPAEPAQQPQDKKENDQD